MKLQSNVEAHQPELGITRYVDKIIKTGQFISSVNQPMKQMRTKKPAPPGTNIDPCIKPHKLFKVSERQAIASGRVSLI